MYPIAHWFGSWHGSHAFNPFMKNCRRSCEDMSSRPTHGTRTKGLWSKAVWDSTWCMESWCSCCCAYIRSVLRNAYRLLTPWINTSTRRSILICKPLPLMRLTERNGVVSTPALNSWIKYVHIHHKLAPGSKSKAQLPQKMICYDGYFFL